MLKQRYLLEHQYLLISFVVNRNQTHTYVTFTPLILFKYILDLFEC